LDKTQVGAKPNTQYPSAHLASQKSSDRMRKM